MKKELNTKLIEYKVKVPFWLYKKYASTIKNNETKFGIRFCNVKYNKECGIAYERDDGNFMQ